MELRDSAHARSLAAALRALLLRASVETRRKAADALDDYEHDRLPGEQGARQRSIPR